MLCTRLSGQPVFQVGCLLLLMIGTSASATPSLIGDDVGASLNGGSFTSVQTPFTGSHVQVIDPGSEFVGVLRTTGYADDPTYPFDTGVLVDIFEDYFTVGLTANNDWGLVGAFGVGGTSTLFGITLTDLDFPGGLGPVTYDSDLSSGFFHPDYIEFISWTDTSVDIGFAWIRSDTTLGFRVVPEPTTLSLLALGGLALLRRRRQVNHNLSN